MFTLTRCKRLFVPTIATILLIIKQSFWQHTPLPNYNTLCLLIATCASDISEIVWTDVSFVLYEARIDKHLCGSEENIDLSLALTNKEFKYS